MGRYVWQWNYKSSYGSGVAGTVADLADSVAEAINRDSPGVLVPDGVEPDEEAEARAIEDAPQDRQIKRGRNRRVEANPPEGESDAD